MKIWAFDVGLQSLGYAVRGHASDPLAFNEVASLLVPEDLGSIEDERKRKRMYRTRRAHKAREAWLRKIFADRGLADAILEGRRVAKTENAWNLSREGDYRLEREFPPASGTKTEDGAPSTSEGARTVYCGALLRALLIAGRDAQVATQARVLEPWQVFKAMHSAMQKRGYDPDLPWAHGNRGNRNEEEREEQEKTNKRANVMQEILQLLPTGCQYPCFWECRQMGLWSPETPDEFELRQRHHAKSTKRGEQPDCFDKEEPAPAVFLRSTVEEELLALCAAAEDLLPSLAGQARLILYGPTEIPYASYKAAHAKPEERATLFQKAGRELVPGKESDWQGVLSQKIPTFDNRVPSQCLLIPRLHAAKARPRIHAENVVPDSLLAAEYVFLKKLKDWRFDAQPSQRGLTPEELCRVYESCQRAAIEAAKASLDQGEGAQQASIAALKGFRLTKTALKKWLRELGGLALLPEQEEIESPSPSGRSPYSRPALRILKQLILSGIPPAEFRQRLLRRAEPSFDSLAKELRLGEDMRTGLVAEDLGFMNNMGSTWDGLYVPDARLDDAARSANNQNAEIRKKMVRKLIAQQNDPIVRHRLDLFHRTLQTLQNRHGTSPDRIVLEFVRDDFMKKGKSKEAKQRYKRFRDFQKQRSIERLAAQAALGGSASNTDVLKYQIWRDQKEDCLFCGRHITAPNTMPEPNGRAFYNAELAHIVPDSMGGPRTYLNLVVACHECNHAQEQRYHADWFKQDQRDWHAFLKRLEGYAGIQRFKRRLLSCADASRAAEMVENRTSLQQTAWISKLCQAVACLHFGWPLDFKATDRKIIVVPGALTNAVARRYGLYRLLGSEEKRAETTAALSALKERAEAAERDELAYDPRREAWEKYRKTLEEAEKKARDDKRHHALDAMVLSFIPAWAVDRNRRFWHSLPEEADYHYFGRYLRQVVPTKIAFKKPKLEDGIYRAKGTQAVKRQPLRTLAYSGRPEKFSASCLQTSAKKICDPLIRNAIEEFAASGPDEAQWGAFHKHFRAPRQDGTEGPRVLSVSTYAGSLAEFVDLSKDGRGAWRKGATHKGYFILIDAADKPEVLPVYAHESVSQRRQEIARREDQTVHDFYESGCRVRLVQPLEQGKQQIPIGEYILSSLWTGSPGKAALESPTGDRWRGISVKRMLECGLERVR